MKNLSGKRINHESLHILSPYMDFAVLHWIQNNLRNPVFDGVFVFFTWLGNYGAIWLMIAILLFCLKKYRRAGAAILLSVALSALFCNFFLKNIVMRPRPFALEEVALLIPAPAGYSFPSGHAASSFAAATALFARNKIYGGAAFFLATLISFSRLYLFVHYPTDVLCGAFFGAASALVILHGVKVKDGARPRRAPSL